MRRRELGRFLAGVELFSALDPAQLAAIAAAATVRQFSAGDLVVDAFTAPPTEIYVVLTGEVDLWHDQDQVTKAGDDRFVAGDVFGFSAMLTERPIGPRVVATTSASIAVLPGNLVEPAFYSRSGARFLADYISRTRRRSTSAPMFSTVEDLIASTPLVIGPDTPVAVVARQLADRDMHCAVVESGDGTYGIVTDAVLGRRVVGDGISGDTPAREVMVHPATTVELSGSSVEALITLLDTRAEYLPVVDRAGKLRGVLGARDFVLAPTTAGFGMLEQIHRARNRAELIERARRAPSVLGDILDRGLAVDRVIRVYSAIVDAIVRRSIQLVFADHPDLALDQFTWLFLGSHGRREAVPGSDVDVAIAFDDDVSPETMERFRRRLRRRQRTAHRRRARCRRQRRQRVEQGLLPDERRVAGRGNALADRTRASTPARPWRSTARAWPSSRPCWWTPGPSTAHPDCRRWHGSSPTSGSTRRRWICCCRNRFRTGPRSGSARCATCSPARATPSTSKPMGCYRW